MITVCKYPLQSDWPSLLKRAIIDNANLENAVSEILLHVKSDGDEALKFYSEKFDGIKINEFLVRDSEIKYAENLLSSELKQAIKNAYNNIYKFHASQKNTEQPVETQEGVKCWRKSVAISKVGLYIPGGTAPLFSTVLMLGIPAQIAGCSEIVLCSPINKETETIHPAILYAANICGISRIFKVGGAQAIAAMTYGTQSVPKCYKIFGPGNQYVTCAKMLAQKDGVAIDMPAGPSELAILADASANAGFVAADILSQAEHGVDSQAILVTNDAELIEVVLYEIGNQLKVLPRQSIAEKALANSKIILVNKIDEGIQLLNDYAPEHLILNLKNANSYLDKIENAGSVFIGNFSPESVGDYASGTNHTLPTNGFAKSYSGVSVDSFVKKITFQQLSNTGLAAIANTVVTMAEAEGLQAHANAVKIRINEKLRYSIKR